MIALETGKQHRAPLVRRVAHFLLLHVLLRVRKRRGHKRAVAALPGIPVISEAAVTRRAAAVRQVRRVPVEDHVGIDSPAPVLRHSLYLDSHIIHLVVVADIDAIHNNGPGSEIRTAFVQRLLRKFEFIPDRIDIKILVMVCLRCGNRRHRCLLRILSRDCRLYFLFLFPHSVLSLLPLSLFLFLTPPFLL